MTRPQTAAAAVRRAAFPALAGAIALACYMATISPGIGALRDTIDGAELVVVAWHLGIAHPPPAPRSGCRWGGSRSTGCR